MEDTGKVDPSVVPKLSTLVSAARANSQYWQSVEGTPRETAFVEYHAWRNISLVLSTVKNRFEHAAAKHENPVVVNETIDVLPSLCVTINLLYETPATEITERERFQLMGRIRNLRSTAERCNMLPSLDEELADVDMQDFKKRLAGFAATVGIELVEE